MTAFDAMCSSPPRPQSVGNVAEEAFGNVEPAALDEHGEEEVAEDEADEGENVHGDEAEDADEGGASG